jgi:hemerythrin
MHFLKRNLTFLICSKEHSDTNLISGISDSLSRKDWKVNLVLNYSEATSDHIFRDVILHSDGFVTVGETHSTTKGLPELIQQLRQQGQVHIQLEELVKRIHHLKLSSEAKRHQMLCDEAVREVLKHKAPDVEQLYLSFDYYLFNHMETQDQAAELLSDDFVLEKDRREFTKKDFIGMRGEILKACKDQRVWTRIYGMLSTTDGKGNGTVSYILSLNWQMNDDPKVKFPMVESEGVDISKRVILDYMDVGFATIKNGKITRLNERSDSWSDAVLKHHSTK